MYVDSLKNIENLLISSLEGGSNYWYTIVDHNMSDFAGYNPKPYLSTLSTKENGFILIQDKENQLKIPFRVDLKSLNEGFGIFKEKYVDHYQDAINENDDAITGDIFLQCVVFGKVIFS